MNAIVVGGGLTGLTAANVLADDGCAASATSIAAGRRSSALSPIVRASAESASGHGAASAFASPRRINSAG